MTTTTLALIRAKYCGTQSQQGVLEALTPTLCSNRRFSRSRIGKPLREWATGESSAAIRQFEWQRSSPAVEPNVLDPVQILRIEQCTITVAYPDLPRMYGADVEGLEDLIRADAHQLRDALVSPGNLIAGCQAVMPAIQAPERGENIWFQDIICEITYYESQSIT